MNNEKERDLGQSGIWTRDRAHPKRESYPQANWSSYLPRKFYLGIRHPWKKLTFLLSCRGKHSHCPVQFWFLDIPWSVYIVKPKRRKFGVQINMIRKRNSSVRDFVLSLFPQRRPWGCGWCQHDRYRFLFGTSQLIKQWDCFKDTLKLWDAEHMATIVAQWISALDF